MDKPAADTPVITTTQGKVRGQVVNGVHRFLGIPYAEPPFGEHRFLPPVRRQAWDGVLPATRYGAICPQTGGLGQGLPDEGEDCLNLNIWTPDPGARGLPVMVWAHGGGQVSGAGSNELYDGTHIAGEGCILVTCNRRLGAEGFLYLEELFGDGFGPGNLGIQDMVMVLRWVTDNIAAFGGDPNNITLFGESGGGVAVQAVIATPGAEGLVRRAILQSGGHAVQRTDTATEISQYVLTTLGIKPGDRERLRQVPFSRFVECYEGIQQLAASQPQPYLPVINEHMPVHPVDAPFEGLGLDVDYLVGTCRDEMNLFSALLPQLEGSVFDQRAHQVIAAGGATFEDVVAAYRRARPGLSDEDIHTVILGDLWFRVPSLRIADGHAARGTGNSYMYLFEWESPLIGAAHALDLMLFGNGLPFAVLAGFADYDNTAEFMRKAWTRFAATGNPSVGGERWPSYREDRATMILNEERSVRSDPYGIERDVLGSVLANNWQELGL